VTSHHEAWCAGRAPVEAGPEARQSSPAIIQKHDPWPFSTLHVPPRTGRGYPPDKAHHPLPRSYHQWFRMHPGNATQKRAYPTAVSLEIKSTQIARLQDERGHSPTALANRDRSGATGKARKRHPKP
jgi:hypothetical protein